MTTRVSTAENTTAKPLIAGIINIVIGGCSLVALSVLGIVILVVGSLTVPVVGFLVVLLAVPVIAMALLALMGGIYAVQRRMWGWALAGSIATAVMSNVLGVVSIVLVALSKGEFADGQAA